MKRIYLIYLLVVLLTGCAISGRGNFPHPVWFWECWEKPSPCG